LPPSLGWLVLFVCLLLALPVQAKTRDIMMHPETGQSLLSLHTRLMWSPLQKHFPHKWRITYRAHRWRGSY
jgi:hypothetical protein